LAEGRENPSRSFLSKLTRGDGRPGGFRTWVSENWAALFMLFFIFLLALFVRAYFAYDISQDNGYIVSGGSDSYYWRRIIDYSADTGKQLFWDPLTAYPDGIRNPRPPLYSMSVVVPGVISQNLFGSLDDAIGFMFVWSTAFWGALTVVPTYFLGKEVFGKRAGLVAAFFLAVMPSHVQRSVLSNADHDAIILFFAVLTFFFLLKAVKNQSQKRWVENWRSPKSIRDGFAAYFRESRTAVLYALMAGTAFGTVIMIWVGFAYVAVLILAYFLIQVMFNRFRNIDSMGVMVLIFIAMGFGFLLSYPVYAEQELLIGRFDVPVYLFLAAMFFGGMFVVSRDIPWTIVLPTVTVVVVVGVALISVFSPALGQAILSGQGYFVKSKLYSTIAEAQAPVFSELALSFGMVTFFMSLIGLIWAIVKMPKKATNAEYIFIVVWLAAAIFMAISAARFMFNAAPAFAISSAWVLVIIVDRLDFNNVRKTLVSGSGSPWQIIRKSIKLRHVVGALFLAFMVVLPNVWYSVDAGIPSDTKQEYDLQIYESLPKFMRPGGYDVNGTNWYLGAFGYQLPLPSYYFPAAWNWFSEQDGDSPPISRPAFVAWWDYGFEAIQEGQHPTVADNFQNGYQLTGNALMAQSETDTIDLFALRLLQTAYKSGELKAEMHTLFEKYNVSVSKMDAILTGPSQPIIDEVLSDPVVYGPMASDLSDANARITAGRVELSKIGVENLVSLYGEICEKTGWSIEYFMVDSRMFPLSGTSTGIFYAPAKLSDRRLVLGSTPVDFYTIKAVLSTGAEVDLDKVTTGDQVTDYKIAYTDMFYDSMFYRAMVGYSGADVGKSNDDGIPGWSGSLYTSAPMPGWDLAHFKMVYRTAYYNPYPTDQIAQHADAWSAMNLQDALDIKKEIDAGTRQGYVDQSAGSYYRAGAVFLKYYPGAIVNGTLTTPDGMPVAGVNVTVSDEFGIPHQITTTDENGFYSAIATQGNITFVFSAGSSSNSQLIGGTVITSVTLNITEDQAMRAPYDLDGNGILDYYITNDVVMNGAAVTGDVFWDLDSDGNYTVKDALIPGATVYATDRNSGKLYSFSAAQGSIDFTLPPGQYDFSATILGRNLTAASQINVTYGKTTTTNLALIPSSLNGTLYYQNGTPAGGIDLVLTDLPFGFERTYTTNDDGTFSFPRLLEGKYSLTTTEPGLVIFDTEIALSQGQEGVYDAAISESATLRYRVVSGGNPLPYGVFTITDYYDPSIRMSGVVDNFGTIETTLPRGLWTLYVSYYDGSSYYAGSVLVSTENVDSVSGNLEMTLATYATGILRDPNNSPVVDAWMNFQNSEGARIWIMTDSFGGYALPLVPGTYKITSQSITKTGFYGSAHAITGDRANIQLRMSKGIVIRGTLWAVKDVNQVPDNSDLASYGMLKYIDDSGNMFTSRATVNGSFEMVFPSGNHVTIGLGDPGFAGWEQNATFTASSNDIGLVAMPDDRVVTGFVTYAGTGLRNIEVSFLPHAPLASAVTVMTGAGGFYSALVPPSNYSVVIDQLTGPAGGEKYQSSSSQVILPAGVAENIDVQPVKRVEMVGSITGGGLSAKLSIEGTEQKTVETTNGSYSVYLLPGSYTIYSTSIQGAVQYANITSVDLSIFTRENDIKLSRSHMLSGVVRIGSSAATKAVTISAESSTGPIIHAKSNTNGAYSLTLPNGDYTVSFLLEDLQTQSGRRLYVEYVGDERVTMGSVDQILSPTLQVRLDNTTFSGTVFASDGQPVQAFVELTASSSFGMSASFSTDASGKFNASVQPGDYTVRVTRLQDNRVALLQVTLVRNVPLGRDVTLSEGRTVSGQVTASDVGAQLTMSVTSGDTRLTVPTDESGSFEMIVPPGNYTMTASTARTENGMLISYSGSQKIVVDKDNMFIEFALTRSTKYGVTITWNKSQEQSADPGVPVTYLVDVTNTGNSVDSYVFSVSTTVVSGLDATFPGSGLIYDYGTNNKLTVPVIVTAKSTTAAGEAKVTIQVKSQSSSATRAEVNLFLTVKTVRGVLIYDLGSSNAVNSQVTETKFSLNNTGNAQDNFVLNITNLDTLESLGWSAKLVDPANGKEVPSVGMPAFFTTPITVKFTAIRENPDPTAEALVLAASTNDPGVNTYAAIPVNLPDLSISKGDLTAARSDLSFTLDTSIVAVDLTLVVIIVGLAVGIFYLRRKKGLGGKSKTAQGGAKK
jgi:dolichyl-phosphooligosaccharide-protein glycotransferase